MVKIWIELEMRLSVSPWLGLLCTYTGHVQYSYRTCPDGMSQQCRFSCSLNSILIDYCPYIYDCLSKLILQALTMDGIDDCEILDK